MDIPRRVFLASIATGIGYGLMTRLVFGLGGLDDYFGVMSASFIFGVPVVIDKLILMPRRARPGRAGGGRIPVRPLLNRA